MTERIGANGEVLEPLDEDSLDEAMSVLAATGVGAVAIGFLHAYANPEHERRARDRVEERHPGLPVAISSEVAPEIREFERISTTVANAFLKPLAERYVERLAERVAAHGIGCRLLLMLSSGGLTDVDEARRFPVRMLESGPAAGAIAAAWFGARAGHDDLLAFDMGGTTAKLCLVDGGEPLVTHAFEACRERRFIPGSGLPLRISALELIEIGAGGGSIARVDELGLLKVGPESAGSEPGPACYGRGGGEPTVTDADLVLGYLDAESFAGGSMPLCREAAAAALASLESRSGLAGFELARGVFDVVTENMVSAARVHIAERGRDPRRYVLLATGGAGPVHAWYLAARLGIERVVCPPSAGVASALGLLLAPARADRVATVAEPLAALDWTRFEATYRRLEGECRSVLAHTGLDAGAGRGRPLRGPPVPRPGLRARRRAARGTVRTGIIGRHRGRVPAGLRTGLLPGAPGSRNRGGERPGRRPDGRGGAGGAGPPRGHARRRGTRGPKGQPARVLPGVRRTGRDSGLRPIRASSRRPLSGSRHRRGARVDGGGRPGRVVRDRRRGEPRDDPGDGRRARPGRSGGGGPPAVSGRPLDAASLEVLWTRLVSITDEAAAALVRTSFSTIVRESHDFSCVLTDAQGRSIAQATDSIPSFISTLPRTVRHFLGEFPAETLAPGDVLVTNDPWMGTGHLPDICVAKPVFQGGALLGFAASTAHAPDIGGRVRSPEAREIFEEGLQIPIMKLLSEGRPNETLLKLLARNVRTPELTAGDLWAQVTALGLMESRLVGLAREYGMESLDGLSNEIRGRTEAAMRSAIRTIPDGCHRAALETDGFDEPLRIELALDIAGDRAVFDSAGTSPQVDRAINLPLCYTEAMSAYAIKCVAAPEVPNNGGSLEAVTVRAPERSLVNPVYPAPVVSRALTGHFIPSLALAALARAIPERVMAMAGSPLWSITQAGVDEAGKPFSNLFFFNGGMGATASRDGESCLSWPSNISSTPTEVIEKLSPLRVLHRGLVPGSGGAGRRRGGLGQEIRLLNTSPAPTVAFLSAERVRIPAEGIGGGGPGATGAVEINGLPVDPKVQHLLQPGDVVTLRTPAAAAMALPPPATRIRRPETAPSATPESARARLPSLATSRKDAVSSPFGREFGHCVRGGNRSVK